MNVQVDFGFPHHTFPLIYADARTHLPPFALWPAFPAADYYGGSVALGVAPFRRSRVPHAADVQDGLGALFVSSRLLEAVLRNPGVRRPATGDAGRRRVRRWRGSDFRAGQRFSSVLTRPASFRIGHWGSSNPAFTMPSGPRRAGGSTASPRPAFSERASRLLCPPLSRTCYFPVQGFPFRLVRWPRAEG